MTHETSKQLFHWVCTHALQCHHICTITLVPIISTNEWTNNTADDHDPHTEHSFRHILLSLMYNNTASDFLGYSETSLLRTLWIRDTSPMRTLSAVSTTQSCVQNYLPIRDTSLYRTAGRVPMVSTIERFHCIQVYNSCTIVVCVYICRSKLINWEGN